MYPGVSQGFCPEQSGFTADDGFVQEIDPALEGSYQVTLADGTTHTAVPVWELFKACCAEFSPEKAAEITGIAADQIELAAKTYATRLDPESGYGNGGIGYMLAIEHGCNAIQNSRALDCLVGITGNWDTPAGNRGPTMGGFTRPDDSQPLLGAKHAPADPSVWPDKQIGVDRIPMLGWWQQWADANAVCDAMVTGEPYKVRAGVCEASGFMNQANSTKYWEGLNSLDFFVVQDLWKTPTAGAADMLLPVYHWLEVDFPRVSQGSTGAMGATCRAIEPPAECRFDPQIVVDIYERMGVTWADAPEFVGFSEGEYWPTMERQLDSVVAGFGMTWKEYRQAFQEHGWWDCREINPEGWGTYRRFETGMLGTPNPVGVAPLTPAGNNMRGFGTTTRKQELWSVVMETYEPDGRFNVPTWEPAPETELANPSITDEWPFLLTTGRRIPVYFHSEHRQLPWCRENWPVPRMEINPADAEELGLEQGDWAWIETKYGKIRECVDIYYGIDKGVVNLEHAWWFPELPAPTHGCLLSNIECIWNPYGQDKFIGSSHMRGVPVKIYKATPENSPFGNPVPCGNDGTEIIHDASDPRLKEWAKLVYGGEE